MFDSRKTLIMYGGLGNQLFQFSYLHLLSQQYGEKINIYFPSPRNGARNFNLASLCDNCAHVNRLILTRKKSIDFRFKLFDFLKTRMPSLKNLSLFNSIYSQENAYEFHDGAVSSRFYSGYFQNWQYVELCVSDIERELQAVLEIEYQLIPEEIRSSEYAVLHFRRGDLLQYVHTMGVLDTTYFAKALTLAINDLGRNIRTLIITDDKNSAFQEFPNLIRDIYGPSDLSEWQALSLMSKAKFVITSNSTFSWWGGLLASRNGSSVYIPRPWFRDWHPNPENALHHPEFLVTPAIFKK